MTDLFPAFAALTLACLAGARLAPVKWHGRFFGLALVCGLMAAGLAVLKFVPDLPARFGSLLSGSGRN